MPTTITCPECAAKIRAPDNIMGRQVNCPKCSARFTAAPAAPPPPSQPPAQAAEDPFAQLDAGEPATGEPETPSGGLVDSRSVAAYSRQNPFLDFLLFRKMIAPIVIQILFWLGVIFLVLSGIIAGATAIGLMIDGRAPVSYVGGQLFMAVVTLFVMPLAWRVYCEVLILFFRIHETVKEIKEDTEKLRRKA